MKRFHLDNSMVKIDPLEGTQPSRRQQPLDVAVLDFWPGSERSDQKTHILPMHQHWMTSKFHATDCDWYPAHTLRLAAQEIHQSLRVKVDLEARAPILHQRSEPPLQSLALRCQRIPAPILPGDVSSLGVEECVYLQPSLHPVSPKVQELGMMNVPQHRVVQRLRVVLRRERIDRLEFVKRVVGHQIEAILLGKAVVGNNHRHLRVNGFE